MVQPSKLQALHVFFFHFFLLKEENHREVTRGKMLSRDKTMVIFKLLPLHLTRSFHGESGDSKLPHLLQQVITCTTKTAKCTVAYGLVQWNDSWCRNFRMMPDGGHAAI